MTGISSNDHYPHDPQAIVAVNSSFQPLVWQIYADFERGKTLLESVPFK